MLGVDTIESDSESGRDTIDWDWDTGRDSSTFTPASLLHFWFFCASWAYSSRSSLASRLGCLPTQP